MEYIVTLPAMRRQSVNHGTKTSKIRNVGQPDSLQSGSLSWTPNRDICSVFSTWTTWTFRNNATNRRDDNHPPDIDPWTIKSYRILDSKRKVKILLY